MNIPYYELVIEQGLCIAVIEPVFEIILAMRMLATNKKEDCRSLGQSQERTLLTLSTYIKHRYVYIRPTLDQFGAQHRAVELHGELNGCATILEITNSNMQ